MSLPASGKFLYFAFGSNLLQQRLLINNPSSIYKTIAKLNNYELSFSSIGLNSKTGWHGGSANIGKSDGSHVWGVVWEINNEDIPSLDRQEVTYKAIEVYVVSPQNITYTCRTYQKDMDTTLDNRPSPHYKDVLVRGAIQSQLPEEYIKYLKNIEDNGYDGKVQLYDKVMDMLEQKT